MSDNGKIAAVFVGFGLLLYFGILNFGPEQLPGPVPVRPGPLPPPSPATEIKWVQYYLSAQTKAEAEHKPMLMYFHAPSCAACKHMDATTFKDRALVDFVMTRTVPYSDYDAREGVTRIAQQYGVHSYPTIIVANVAGKEIGRVETVDTAAELLPKLRKWVN